MIPEINDRDLVSMKLLHFLITKKNYSPIIVQGVENEIWLQNLQEEYKVIRIVNNYIHNDEQMEFDVYKTKKMVNKIKLKTFSLSIKTLNILTDVGDNVDRDKKHSNDIDIVILSNEKDIKKSKKINEIFPDLKDNMEYSEEGFQLFLKISEEINVKNRNDSIENEKIFEPKKPVITYLLLGILVVVFALQYIYPNLINKFCVHGPSIVINREYYRIITGAFLHANFMHIVCNGYALYAIGSNIESFYGKKKYIIIYLFSAICGSLLSIVMSDSPAVGASGAIFGLLGSMLYFGYHYRVYIGQVLINKILPVIILNLGIGFILPSVDNWGHIGGLIGGYLISMALGINSKNTKREKINGLVLSSIFVVFLLILEFVVKK